jgi:hypothetical protein
VQSLPEEETNLLSVTKMIENRLSLRCRDKMLWNTAKTAPLTLPLDSTARPAYFEEDPV